MIGLAALAALPMAGSVLSQADPSALNGEWVYLEDLTPNRPLEQMGPPMTSRFVLAAEPGVMILVSGHGSGHRNVRVALDGTALDVPDPQGGSVVRYRAYWKEGVFSYETEYQRTPGGAFEGKIRKDMKLTDRGLSVSVTVRGNTSTGLYKHPEDIAMPTPAKATIADLAWFAGAWTGTRGTNNAISMEERWSPPKGGSMLAISRTVNRDRLSAFEYLRIVERDGGLVYIAQPNGAAPTEFILTEFSASRAVFENPRHDYPKKITYERSGDALTATIGYLKGGTPRKFEFKRES